MRDRSQMNTLLREMAKLDGGRIPNTSWRDEGESQAESEAYHHQLELLVDEGLAQWVKDSTSSVRITSTGYDHLERLEAIASMKAKRTALKEQTP